MGIPEEVHYGLEEGLELVASVVGNDDSCSVGTLQPQPHRHASGILWEEGGRGEGGGGEEGLVTVDSL